MRLCLFVAPLEHFRFLTHVHPQCMIGTTSIVASPTAIRQYTLVDDWLTFRYHNLLRRNIENKPDRTIIGEIVPYPVDEHVDSVSEAHQGDQVQPKPREPCQIASQLNPVVNPRDGAAAPDGRHDPPVNVTECLLFFTCNPAQD